MRCCGNNRDAREQRFPEAGTNFVEVPATAWHVRERMVWIEPALLVSHSSDSHQRVITLEDAA